MFDILYADVGIEEEVADIEDDIGIDAFGLIVGDDCGGGLVAAFVAVDCED